MRDGYLVGLHIETFWDTGFCAVAKEIFLTEAFWFVILGNAFRKGHCAPRFSSKCEKGQENLELTG